MFYDLFIFNKVMCKGACKNALKYLNWFAFLLRIIKFLVAVVVMPNDPDTVSQQLIKLNKQNYRSNGDGMHAYNKSHHSTALLFIHFAVWWVEMQFISEVDAVLTYSWFVWSPSRCKIRDVDILWLKSCWIEIFLSYLGQRYTVYLFIIEQLI